jgi:hypothetical protein
VFRKFYCLHNDLVSLYKLPLGQTLSGHSEHLTMSHEIDIVERARHPRSSDWLSGEFLSIC